MILNDTTNNKGVRISQVFHLLEIIVVPTRKTDSIASKFSAEYIPAAKIEILSVLTFELCAGLQEDRATPCVGSTNIH